MRYGCREEIGDADDVDELAKENEEDGYGGAVRAGSDGAQGHEEIVPFVGEREELKEGDLVLVLLCLFTLIMATTTFSLVVTLVVIVHVSCMAPLRAYY